jgi:ribosomal protein S11
MILTFTGFGASGGGGGASAGASGQVQTSDGAGGFSAPANVLAGADFVSIGANPAASGGGRFANATELKWRNPANSADISVINYNAGNNLLIGASTAGTASAVNVIVNPTTSIDLRVNNSTALVTNASRNLAFCAGSGSYGGGQAVAFIGNATVVPTTNPTGGGILYVTAGGLVYRGSAGTVTPLAPA